MKFQEPLELSCPNCAHSFTCSLAWILQEGQLCPGCSESLESIRSEIEEEINSFNQLLESLERILALEEEFEISIPDSDAAKLRTLGVAHDYLLRKLHPDCNDQNVVLETWQRMLGAVEEFFEFDDPFRKPARDDLFIRSDLGQ